MVAPDGGSLVLSSAEAATDPTPFQPVVADSATALENTIWVPHAPRIVCTVRGAGGGMCCNELRARPLPLHHPGPHP